MCVLIIRQLSSILSPPPVARGIRWASAEVWDTNQHPSQATTLKTIASVQLPSQQYDNNNILPHRFLHSPPPPKEYVQKIRDLRVYKGQAGILVVVSDSRNKNPWDLRLAEICLSLVCYVAFWKNTGENLDEVSQVSFRGFCIFCLFFFFFFFFLHI